MEPFSPFSLYQSLQSVLPQRSKSASSLDQTLCSQIPRHTSAEPLCCSPFLSLPHRHQINTAHHQVLWYGPAMVPCSAFQVSSEISALPPYEPSHSLGHLPCHRTFAQTVPVSWIFLACYTLLLIFPIQLRWSYFSFFSRKTFLITSPAPWLSAPFEILLWPRHLPYCSRYNWHFATGKIM